MKKTLFTSILALCCASAAMATSYTTQNGVSVWTESDEGEPTASDVVKNGGNYTGFSFTISSDSLNADVPVGTTGSLTTVTSGDAADATLTADTSLSVTSITVYQRASYDWDNDNAIYLCYIAEDGTTYYSEAGDCLSTAYATDPWDSSVTSTSLNTLVFTFSDDSFVIDVDTSYKLMFVTGVTDEDTGTITYSGYGTTEVSLHATLGSDSDWDLYNSATNIPNTSYGATGLTINTTTYTAVPEPATATLSLVALAGLMVRRRRQA